ncbi:MAG: MT-A70 family methyltransferase [Planctomycetota bacterium]|nr:MT-A70 family methyltransferase [Planctomycetota bacterium]
MGGITEFEGLHGRFKTILIDPPWRFQNRTGKMAPEHKRLRRYETLSMQEIRDLPVADHAEPNSHLYLWTPNALLPDALDIMKTWGFTYKTNLVWFKVRKDGGPDRRGVGFYYRNVTELLLFGVRGSLRTDRPARSQENLLAWQKQEHSRKPPDMRKIIERCSFAPFVELFAREKVEDWTTWGDQCDTYMDDRQIHPTYRGNGEFAHKLGAD